MKIYTLVGGVNGTGKSSLMGVLNAERGDLGLIVDVDRIAQERGCGPIEAGKIALHQIGRCLENGVSFTQETTLTSHQVLRTVRRARDGGYVVRLFYVGLNSAEECQRRIRNRVAKGGHSIPPADVTRRFASRFPVLLKVLPYCDKGTFFDNENGFQAVAEYRNGEIRGIGEYKPNWVAELLKAAGQQKLHDEKLNEPER